MDGPIHLKTSIAYSLYISCCGSICCELRLLSKYNSRSLCKENQKKEIDRPSSKENLCHFCKKPFSTYKNLKRHIKIHTREKSYPCLKKNCKMSFTRKDHLNTHMWKHTQKKSFFCHICHRAFSFKNSINKHLRNKVCTK